MDELFLIPSSPIAMPQAYWKEGTENLFTSALILTEPSAVDFTQMMQAISEANYSTTFDMEILNNLFGATALTVPHRPYLLLSGELRSDQHVAYLGNAQETWNTEAVLREAKYVHFSDWPVPKVSCNSGSCILRSLGILMCFCSLGLRVAKTSLKKHSLGVRSTY